MIQTWYFYHTSTVSGRSSLWIEWNAKSKDTHFRSLSSSWGGARFVFPFLLRVMAHKGWGGIRKLWQKHDIKLETKGKATFSGRFVYHEVNGSWRFLYFEFDELRGKRLPLIILSGGKHWYALSMEVSIDKQGCECVQLIVISGGKHWYALSMEVSIGKQGCGCVQTFGCAQWR